MGKTKKEIRRHTRQRLQPLLYPTNWRGEEILLPRFIDDDPVVLVNGPLASVRIFFYVFSTACIACCLICSSNKVFLRLFFLRFAV